MKYRINKRMDPWTEFVDFTNIDPTLYSIIFFCDSFVL